MGGVPALDLRIDAMTPADASDVRRIHLEGIATGDATLERDAPDWEHFDRSHRADCRFVARDLASGRVLGWVALAPYSPRPVYAGVAWESVYVSVDARGRGVGTRLLERVIAAAQAADLWTLMAGILADNGPSRALHARAGFREIGVQHALGQDRWGRWRDVVLVERRRPL